MAVPATKRSRLRDKDVRSAVHQLLVPELTGYSPSRVLDEFDLCLGEARIDVAILNGQLHGIEIKSESDTLERLEHQVDAYGKVFDTMTIVCGQNHLESVCMAVPKWWGVYSANSNGCTDVTLEMIRPNGQNPNVEAEALAQLLWKEELISLLRAGGVSEKLTSRSKRALWPSLIAAYPLPKLKALVRETLKFREDWRPDSPRM